MKKESLRYLAGLLAMGLGVVTTMASFATILGLKTPDWVIFWPLLISQAILGPANLLVGFAILKKIRYRLLLSNGILLVNLTILITITGYRFIYPNSVAHESLLAMAMRSTVWALIVGLILLERKKS